MALPVSREHPMCAEAAASLVERSMKPHLCPVKRREMEDENRVRKLQVTITELQVSS